MDPNVHSVVALDDPMGLSHITYLKFCFPLKYILPPDFPLLINFTVIPPPLSP